MLKVVKTKHAQDIFDQKVNILMIIMRKIKIICCMIYVVYSVYITVDIKW